MSVTSERSINIQLTGDVEYQQTFSAETNATSPGDNGLVELSSGNNTIDVPDGSVAVTIIKPEDNDVQISLKVVGGDTGWDLGLTDPDSISMNGITSFVLNADDDVTVRLTFT